MHRILAHGKAPDPVFLPVSAAHVSMPHEILFRLEDGIVIDARTRPSPHATETVETLLQKAGADLPAGDDELFIIFNPHNGQVVAVLPKPAGKAGKVKLIH